MSRIFLPALFRQYTGQSAIEAEGRTVLEVVQNLIQGYPQLKPYLLAETKGLTTFVNFYLNNQDIRTLANEATPVKETDTITIIPALAGG